MIPSLATATAYLVCSIWMVRAHLRGDHHIVSRLAGAVSLTIAASFGYAASQGRFSMVAAVALAAVTLTLFAIGLAKGRYRAQRH